MAFKKVLGRGLDALIPESMGANSSQKVIREINIDLIRPGPFQTRTDFKKEAIASLALSIKEHGMLQPVLVREIADGYELIAGERRFRACQAAGLKIINAIVKHSDDTEAAVVSLIENIQRQDLNPIEEAKAYDQLATRHRYTQEEISRKAGKSRPFVANALRLLGLPEEIKKMLEKGLLTSGHARALLTLSFPERQLKTAEKIIAGKLNVRQTENLVKNMNLRLTGKTTPGRTESEQFFNYSEKEKKLQNILQAKTKIKASVNGGGKIEISYKDTEHLEKILEMFHVKHFP